MYSIRYIRDEYLARQYNTSNMKHESIVRDWRRNCHHLPDEACNGDGDSPAFGSPSHPRHHPSPGHKAIAAQLIRVSSGKAQVTHVVMPLLTRAIMSTNCPGHKGLVFSVFHTHPKKYRLGKVDEVVGKISPLPYRVLYHEYDWRVASTQTPSTWK